MNCTAKTSSLLSLAIALSLPFAATEAFSNNYRVGHQYFRQGQYMRSAPEFFKAWAYPPDKATKLKSEWGLAKSLHSLGLLYSASRYYSIIVRRGAGAENPFFEKSLEELGKINNTISLGNAHINQLFQGKIQPSRIPGPARGFYFYYKGLDFFSKKEFSQAAEYFMRVTEVSDYHLKAKFHLGVISNLEGKHQRAIAFFEQVRRGAPATKNGEWLREQAALNIARVHYETKRFVDAIRYYSEIPRGSDNWLQTIFETAWAFFLMEKHNNTLGNIHTIHSPFFDNRFYPESYILQAITFLRLCRYKQVDTSLKEFRTRYRPVMKTLSSLNSRFQGDGRGFFRLIYQYRYGSAGGSYQRVFSILDALSRTDSYKEASNTIRFADRELARLSSAPSVWQSVGLSRELRTFLQGKKGLAASDAGKKLYKQAISYQRYLKRLSDQTQFIVLEKQFGKIDQLREKIGRGQANNKVQFIGGLQALNLSQDLEYWPFEGEYWEDELGYYVFNTPSMCKAKK
jgi:tetratricopeptide (TPR) repeat protein